MSSGQGNTAEDSLRRNRAKAAVFVEAGRSLEVREYPVTEPGPSTAAVDLISSGICGTDVHIWEGALAIPGPVIPGHEFLGRVSELGAPERGSPFADCMG